MVNEELTRDYAERMYVSITNLFLNEEDRECLEIITEDELTENFKEIMAGLLFATNNIFCNLTGEEIDVLEFTHILNTLAVEYLMDHGTLEEDMSDFDTDDKLNVINGTGKFLN